jgi:polysaccharide pyruvyl transferase WcaK-like protein
VPNVEVTTLAFDYRSFDKHRKNLGSFVRVLPMPSIIDSLRPIRILFGMAASIGLRGLFGSLFLISSLALMPFLRRFDKQLDCSLRSIDDSNLVIVVGGNYIYSHFDFYTHAIPIVYAKFLRKKRTVMLGHSIGPFEGVLDRAVSRVILSRINLITFREELSYLYVKKNLKINSPNALLSCDMTFFLQSLNLTYKISENQPKVGITARKWLFNQPDLYKKYVDSITQAAFNLIKEGFEVYLIPFSYMKGAEDDLEPCKTIYAKLSNKYPEKVYLINVKEESPTSLVKIMRKLGLNILIGTRMHSVLLASLAGIPSVIISYQHFKAHGISKQLGLDNYIVNIEKIDPDKLIHYINKLIKNREEIRKRIIMAVQRLKKINEPRISSIVTNLVIECK